MNGIEDDYLSYKVLEYADLTKEMEEARSGSLLNNTPPTVPPRYLWLWHVVAHPQQQYPKFLPLLPVGSNTLAAAATQSPIPRSRVGSPESVAANDSDSSNAVAALVKRSDARERSHERALASARPAMDSDSDSTPKNVTTRAS